MLLIAVDVLEIFWQYELISDGKVIFKKMDDIVCDEDPIYCSLPAGGKFSNKRATKKKNKEENEKKRNEDKKERKKKMKEKNGRKERRKNKKKRGLRED